VSAVSVFGSGLLGKETEGAASDKLLTPSAIERKKASICPSTTLGLLY